MRFAFNPCMPETSHYLPLAQYVEQAGFDAITIPDSICFPRESDTEYPYNNDGTRNFLENVPFIEPFSLIPAMAAVTEKVIFSTSVLKLPIRHPVLVAKSITSIAALSPGRLELGVGLSPWPEDFKVCGERWEGRGPRMDEMITIMRGLMTGEFFEFHGKFYDIPAIKLCPTPAVPVPILFGGHAEPALKRAAMIGDGWIHAGGDYNSLKPLVEKINQYRKEYGRDQLPFKIIAITGEAFSVDGVKRLEELGVAECVVGFRDVYSTQPDQPFDEKKKMIDWFVNTIMRKVNG